MSQWKAPVPVRGPEEVEENLHRELFGASESEIELVGEHFELLGESGAVEGDAGAPAVDEDFMNGMFG